MLSHPPGPTHSLWLFPLTRPIRPAPIHVPLTKQNPFKNYSPHTCNYNYELSWATCPLNLGVPALWLPLVHWTVEQYIAKIDINGHLILVLLDSGSKKTMVDVALCEAVGLRYQYAQGLEFSKYLTVGN